jgi:hypothetical protein
MLTAFGEGYRANLDPDGRTGERPQGAGGVRDASGLIYSHRESTHSCWGLHAANGEAGRILDPSTVPSGRL